MDGILFTSAEEEAAAHAFFEGFSEVEVRVMSLIALGWTMPSIAAQLHRSSAPAIIAGCRKKVQLSRTGLGMLYVEKLLFFDTKGYKERGQKLEVWRRTACERREAILAEPLFSPVVAKAVMAQASLRNVDLPDETLARLTSPNLSVSAYNGYMVQASAVLRSIYEGIQEQRAAEGKRRAPTTHGRNPILTVARLAPLGDVI